MGYVSKELDGDIMNVRVNKKVNVGVLVGKALTYHPQELVQGIYQAAKDYDANVIYILGTQRTQDDDVLKEFGDAENYDYQINTIYDYPNLAGLDVLIISYGTIGVHLAVNDKAMFLEKFSNIPYIVLEDEDDGNYIISDNYQGMQTIIEHLVVDHQYKKVAFISGPKGNLDAMQRKQAYIDTMKSHGLEIPEGYICYGNFSAASGVIVEELLQKYPDLEAVACANDEMALGAFETCRRMEIRIGEELAITGYDNCSLSEDMDPPLTTVDQNGFDMGYRALKEAVNLVKGSDRIVMKIPASFCKRESCGCVVQKKSQSIAFENSQYLLTHVEETAADIADRIVKNRENKDLLAVARSNIEELLHFIYDIYLNDNIMIDAEEQRKQLLYLVRRIINGDYGKVITASILIKELGEVFQAFQSQEIQPEKKSRILMISTSLEEYVYSCMFRQKEQDYNYYRTQSSMNSFFERKLMENISDEQQMFYNCVKGLKFMGLRGAMVCVTKEPVLCKLGKEWECPKELYLAAMFNQDEMIAFEEKERPVINEEHGLTSFFTQDYIQNYMTFPLFSGENHYGILLCDAEPEDMSSAYTYSLTLGSVLRFMQISKAEKVVQNKLHGSMRLLQEKNKVLSFISAFDELTGMLNRRGFGEKAFEFTKKNLGKQAYFVFGDLDHLKEINDKYGHAEGDYAIIQCARVLNSNCGKNDLVGRIGGDEFIMMIASDETDFEEQIRQNIKESFAELNHSSDKPFYVEASIGVKSFICDEEFDFSGILQQSDKVMYESKKKRRASVIREENR